MNTLVFLILVAFGRPGMLAPADPQPAVVVGTDMAKCEAAGAMLKAKLEADHPELVLRFKCVEVKADA